MGPTPPLVRPALHIWMDGWTDIQTDGDYIKHVVHGPPGDHMLKKTRIMGDILVEKSIFWVCVVLLHSGQKKQQVVGYWNNF